MKIPSLFFIFIVSLAIYACENPMMANILGTRNDGDKILIPDYGYKKPNADDFYFKGNWSNDYLLSNGVWYVQYDGYPKKVTVTAKPGKIGGKITIYYQSANDINYDSKNTIPPSEYGTYRVTFDVAADNGWSAAYGLYAGTLIITTIGTSVDELNNYLSGLSANSADNPQLIHMNVSKLDGFREALKSAPTIYVNLDLSGSTITSIGEEAFSGCTSLASITIPNSVQSIGEEAFFGCTSLADVIIPNNVTSIGDCAFLECTSLASVTIGNSVQSIGNGAFNSCTSLESITIPNSVTSIGDYAFIYCDSLTSVTFDGTIPSTGWLGSSTDNVFYGDLQTKYMAANGGKGTYTRPDTTSSTWTRKQ